MIKSSTYLDGYTFDAILEYVEAKFCVERLTATQIAKIMEACKEQNEMGYNRCGNEFGLWKQK